MQNGNGLAQTIALATHKGGTGKSTSAISLAAAYADAGQRTLLIDLDPQGHSSLGLGVEVLEGEPSVVDILLEPDHRKEASEVIRSVPDRPRLDILPSTITLARTAQMLYMRHRREDLLARAINPLRSQYRYIIIDCPPALGPLTEAAVGAADLILIPCLFEARAAEGLVDLVELIQAVKGPEFGNWKLFHTRVDPTATVTIQAITMRLDPWKDRILGTQIPKNEALNQAQIAQQDIFRFEPKSKGADAYKHLAEEIQQTHG